MEGMYVIVSEQKIFKFQRNGGGGGRESFMYFQAASLRGGNLPPAALAQEGKIGKKMYDANRTP